MSSPESCRFRLRVVAEADAGAFARVLERFQNLNVLPRRVFAKLGGDGMFYIRVELAGVPEGTLALIASKLAQAPSILSTAWCRV